GFHADENTVGVICWLNGKIQSADIFANHALFAGSMSKLFRSYAVDAQLEQGARAMQIDMMVCRSFLSEIVSARREEADRSTFGNTFRLKDGKILGYEAGNAAFG